MMRSGKHLLISSLFTIILWSIMVAHILDSACDPFPPQHISLPLLYKHSRGATSVLLHDVIVWQWFLVRDSHPSSYDTVCRGVCSVKWRNSSSSPNSVWDRLLTQRLPQPAFDANRCGLSKSVASQVLMLYPLRPRPSHSAVASVPEGLMIIQSHLWLRHQNSWMCFVPEFRDENFFSEL